MVCSSLAWPIGVLADVPAKTGTTWRGNSDIGLGLANKVKDSVRVRDYMDEW